MLCHLYEGLEHPGILVSTGVLEPILVPTGTKRWLYTHSMWPSHSTPGYLPKRNESIYPHKDLYMNFVAALFVTANN